MNTWIEHDRSYLTTYVKAENAGYYQFEVQYAGAMTTLLQYRINSSDDDKWKSKLSAVWILTGKIPTGQLCR